jgi:hypothetical protein
MVAITALVAQPTFGAGIPPNTLLVFTEESDTLLTATTTGGAAFGTVSFTSSDHWTWTIPTDRPNVDLIQNLSTTAWLEPDVPPVNTANALTSFFTAPRGGLTISSDLDFGNHTVVPDSTIVPAYFTFTYVGGTSETFDVQFIDKGDVATVPDTGTTFSLLGLSLTGLGFLRRKLC